MKTTCGLWSRSPKPPNFTEFHSQLLFFFFPLTSSQFLGRSPAFGQTNTKVIGVTDMVRKDDPVGSHPVPLSLEAFVIRNT